MKPAASHFYVRRDGLVGGAWVACLADGTVTARDRLDRVVGRGARVTLLAPAPDVRVTEIGVPSGSRAQVRQALPFLVEESLAEELGNVCLAPGERTASGGLAVAVVARRRLAGWLAALEASGAQLDAVVPESLCLPWTPGTLTALERGDRLFLRWGATNAMVVDEATVAPLLTYLHGAVVDGRLTELRWIAASNSSLSGETLSGETLSGGTSSGETGPGPWPALAGLGLPCVPESLDEAALNRLAEQRPLGIDLVRAAGPASVPSAGRSWRMVAGAAALLLVLAGLGYWLDLRDLRSLRDAHDERARAAYLDAFPQTRRVDDVERLVRQRLRAAQDSGRSVEQRGDFLALLAAVGDRAGDGMPVLASLSYRQGVLELDVVAPTIADVERWRTALVEAVPGLQAQALSLLASPDGARGRLRVSMAP